MDDYLASLEPAGDDELWIWICRWEEFQHYKPERDRPPKWIKDYPKQLDDARYLRLSDRQRALLRDLRDIFATMHGRVPDDAATIARRRGRQTRDEDLKALKQAGLIASVSRESLESALEHFYSLREKEKKNKKEKTPPSLPAVARPAGRQGGREDENEGAWNPPTPLLREMP